MDFPFLEEISGNAAKLLTAHESRTPEYFPSKKPDRFRHLFTLQDAENVLTKSVVPPEIVGVVRGGDSTPAGLISCSFPLGIGGPSYNMIDPSRVAELFKSGSTVLIRGTQTFHAPIKEFALRLEGEISHPMSINCYITPPQAAGLARHYDMHDVIVLQVEGSKTWEIGPRGFMNPLEGRHPHKGGSGAVEEQTITMNAGDVLYLPRGYLHRCVAGREVPSLHLTIGILTRSRHDILADLLEEAADEPFFREGMPFGFLRTGEIEQDELNKIAMEFSSWSDKAREKVFDREKKIIDTTRRIPEANVFGV